MVLTNIKCERRLTADMETATPPRVAVIPKKERRLNTMEDTRSAEYLLHEIIRRCVNLRPYEKEPPVYLSPAVEEALRRIENNARAILMRMPEPPAVRPRMSFTEAEYERMERE